MHHLEQHTTRVVHGRVRPARRRRTTTAATARRRQKTGSLEALARGRPPPRRVPTARAGQGRHARGDAAGAAWLVGSSPARGLINNAAYAAALKACGKAGDTERAEKLLAEMREKGL